MTDEEDLTAQLLRLAGAPPDPPADRAARVHDVVHGEWRAIRRRQRVGRFVAIGLAAAAASLLIVVSMNRPRTSTPIASEAIAVGQRIQGRPVIVRHAEQSGHVESLLASSSVYPGDVIETDGTSRVAVVVIDGSSVRIDNGSRLRFLTPAVIEVLSGAVYIATSPGSRGFEVRTTHGAVRDLGTQFEVRQVGPSLRIRVRSGTVELGHGANATRVGPGTEATVTRAGVSSQGIAVYGSEWAWTTSVAPAFQMEGRTLRALLDHLVAEEGWTLRFSDPAIAEAAGHILLHGSVQGRNGEEVLGAALATSGYEYRLRDGVVVVSPLTDAR